MHRRSLAGRLTPLALLVLQLAAFPAASPAADKAQLQLAVKGVAAYPAYVAKHLEYFAEEGLDVEVVSGTCHHLPHVCRASTALVQQVSSGTTLIGWGVPAAVLPAVERGERLKFFYTYGVRSFFDVVVPDASPIKTVADLRGKTVGITDRRYGEVAFVRAVLATASLRPGDDVTTVVIDHRAPQVLASLRDGAVQAVGGSVEELAALARAGFNVRSLSGEYGELPSSGIFVTEKTFHERREQLAKVGRAVARATLFALTNPPAAASIMARMVPAQFQSNESGRTLLGTYLALSTPSRRDDRGELVFGAAMPGGWARLRTLALLGGSPVGDRPADLDTVVTGELIPEVNRFDREKVRQQARAARP